MASRAVKRKKELGPGQIARLNKRLKAIEEGNEPEKSAAELAEHMRRYGLKEWGGISLGAADMRANTLLFSCQTYHGGRYWTGPRAAPSWVSGHSLLTLFTPSVEQALVLKYTAKPAWPDTQTRTGIHYMPRHPEKGSFIDLEAHWHTLPSSVPYWGLMGYNWENCCNRQAIDREITSPVAEMAYACAPVDQIRAEMVKVWQKVFGPARPCWV